ncbi:protease modulator HflC [Alterisphingorhabdus coralli]|uniref:Protease modulator HflC n=1 Tax=Alterisphingorhabdus coralli TaxID=3071408 RepID=A0AA97F894_9SPHN|nr:protease modulator HflC [Parasphingorhabdus sp. SCSIO 66989]WOE75808.1 protease modulator HflC [Parasphingorhabdus sp. SCSIO 66989]
MNGRLANPMFLGVAAVVTLILVALSVSVVQETEQALILRYGEPVRKVNVYEPNEAFGTTGAGIAFRIPFVEQIQYIDKRVLNVQMERQEVLSTDKLRLQVDAFARFRITNPLQMYRSIRTEDALRTQLRTILGSSLRNELGKRSFATLLSPERGQVMENIQTALNVQARKYGAEIIDVRIKRADLPEGTPLESAFSRMRSERQQEATAIRAEGNKDAQVIRGQAEAESARIYAESYGKDPGFYDFYRAMQSYEQTFNRGDGEASVVLSPDSEYLRQFRGR